MTVEAAIPLAIDAVKKLFSGSDHRLEEVELLDDGGFEITISFHSPDTQRNSVMKLGGDSFFGKLQGGRAAIGIDPYRIYKDVVISKDGQVRSVRMRQIVLG